MPLTWTTRNQSLTCIEIHLTSATACCEPNHSPSISGKQVGLGQRNRPKVPKRGRRVAEQLNQKETELTPWRARRAGRVCRPMKWGTWERRSNILASITWTKSSSFLKSSPNIGRSPLRVIFWIRAPSGKPSSRNGNPSPARKRHKVRMAIWPL